MLQLRTDAEALVAHVTRRGFALVAVPGLAARVTACVAWSRMFFALPFEAKRSVGAGPGLGQQHGYMQLGPTELFECRDFHDPRFSWPPGCRDAVASLATHLRSVAVSVLALLVPEAVALLDRSAQQQPLETASHSTLRVLHYCDPTPVAAGHVFGVGSHTDNSFLTVAPRATAAALELLPFDDQGAWLDVERVMPDDAVCVFVGDSLSKLTGGRIPSVIHRPSQQACLDALAHGQGRVSMPYFLRGRLDAVLPGGDTEPVTVAQLENNERGCRATWPWKRCPYYEANHVFLPRE